MGKSLHLSGKAQLGGVHNGDSNAMQRQLHRPPVNPQASAHDPTGDLEAESCNATATQATYRVSSMLTVKGQPWQESSDSEDILS